MSDLLRDLAAALARDGFAGELEFSLGQRIAGSTDNSIYQLLPDAIAFPTDARDLKTLVGILNRPEFSHIPITSRGAATGTNGQSLNHGLVVDFRRHMTRILRLDEKAGWVDVEPGVSLDAVNARVAPMGLHFAPQTSTANRCTIGGMVATDASGQGSKVYGKTSDNVLELGVLLADGTDIIARPVPVQGGRIASPTLQKEQALFQTLCAACDAGRAALEANVPALTRRFSGYDLIRARPDYTVFDPVRLFAGSEGTLGLITRARLRLMPLPKHRRLVVLIYRGFVEALGAAQTLARFDPHSVETIDDQLLQIAASNDQLGAIPAEVRTHMGAESPHALNYVEFVGDDPAALDEQATALRDSIVQNAEVLAGYVTADPTEMQALWSIRKLAVGILAGRRTHRRPIAFIEDCVVAPERLPEFVSELRTLLDGHGLGFGMFGHVDVGCLHVRPALNISDDKDRALVADISRQVFALVQKHDGLFWGEHGKGVRGQLLPETVGAEAYAAFAKIKSILDPNNRLNPGKIVTPDADTERLYTIGETTFRQMAAQETFAGFEDVYRCNGNAQCQSLFNATPMCPSFKATGDVRHSPKGRSDILRAWLTHRAGDGRLDPAFTEEVKEVMDGCLGCKACTSTCPVQVDIPEAKSLFLNAYHQSKAYSLRDRLVLNIEGLAGAIAAFPRLSSAAMALGRPIMRQIDLVDLPAVSKRTGFGKPRSGAAPINLIVDVLTGTFDQTVVADVTSALIRLGYDPQPVPVTRFGKPQHALGQRDAFRRRAEAAVARLNALDPDVPLVAVDPATALLFRQEYRKLGCEPRTKVQLIQEFLFDEVSRERVAHWPQPATRNAEPIPLLLHCTERSAIPESAKMWIAVFERLGIDIHVPHLGCCGMAGVFGHLAENQTVSRRLWDMGWGAFARTGGPAAVATGFSCRCQSGRFGQRPLRHPLQLLVQ